MGAMLIFESRDLVKKKVAFLINNGGRRIICFTKDSLAIRCVTRIRLNVIMKIAWRLASVEIFA